MLHAGSGLSTKPSTKEAAAEAARQALAASGGDRADLVLAFATGVPDLPAADLLRTVRRVTGARTVVGATGAGVLTERGEVEQVPAVAVLAVRHDRLLLVPALVAGRETLDAAAGAELAEQVGAVVAEGGSLFVLPDPQCEPARAARRTDRLAGAGSGDRRRRGRRARVRVV